MPRLAPGITPEIAAAVSKLMRNQDLVLAARKCRVVTAFRNTIGLPGTMSVRLQPNHPTDDVEGIMASIADGLMYGAGDAVIGINPASDSHGARAQPAGDAGRPDLAVSNSDPKLRADPCDDRDRR